MSRTSTTTRREGSATELQPAAFRTALVNRLRAGRSYAVLTLVAPPGYGKSTLLAQWASRDDRAFVWATGAGYDWAAFGKPTVLVFDDAHLLDAETAGAVGRLVATVPAGSMLVLSGRSVPAIPHLSLPRLRASGHLLELGPRDLALTRREAGALVKGLGSTASGPQLSELLERTEGWAAGMTQAVRSGHTTPEGAFDGNGVTATFFREQCLSQVTAEQRAFLRRTSVLEQMSGPLCDAVLETSGSARTLDALDGLGLFLVPLDHRGEWYRYHHLLRGLLVEELDAAEPGAAPALHRRAADWLERHGDAEAAIDEAYRAGESGTFLRIFEASAVATRDEGRDAAVEDWLARTGADLLAQSPQAAVVAARLHAHRGRLEEAERCLAVTRGKLGGDPVTRARAALVRAAMCRAGVNAMQNGAARAVAQLRRDDAWYPYGLLLQGVASALAGADDRADAILSRAVHAAERLGATETRMLALTERALLACLRGSHAEGAAHLNAAARGAGTVEPYATFALTTALSAQEHLRHGRWNDAQAAVARAGESVRGLTEALPWLAVQARIELAAAHVMLRDAASARALVAEIDGVLAVRPELGRLFERRRRVAREIRAIPPSRDGQTARLTGAELRLLPLLGTHLSFREIGGRLYLSRHTVKTQAISAYRKLGASSRREAVLQAVQLGLIDPAGDRVDA